MESRERRLCELAKKLLGPTLHATATEGLQVIVLLEQATLGELSDRRRWPCMTCARTTPPPHTNCGPVSDFR